MTLELDNIVEEFISGSFSIKDTFYNIVKPKQNGFQKTEKYPGFIFPIRGQAKYYFDGIPYIATPGKIIHGGSLMDLDKMVLGNNNWEFMTVLYDIETREERLDLNNLHFELDIGESTSIVDNLFKLNESKGDNSPLDIFKRENTFRNILEEVFVNSKNYGMDGSYGVFKNIAEYIQRHYREPLSVSEISDIYGVSENQLYYIFKKHIDISPSQYIKELKLNKARKFLLLSENSIKDISEHLGYMDPLYFSKLFKSEFGLSPNKYRNKFKKNPYNIKDSSILIENII